MPDNEKQNDAAETSSSEDVEELLEQLGGPGEVRISVYRYARTGGREFLETIPAPFEGDVLEDVRERFGGGRFLLQFRQGKSIAAVRTVRIAGAPKLLADDEPEEEDDAEDTEADRVAALERALAEKERELRDRDFKDLIGGLASEIRDIREQLRNPPPQAEQVNPAELALSIMGALQKQTEPYINALLDRKAPEPTAEKMMELFLAGMDAAHDSETRDGYMGVVREIGRPLIGILDRMAPGSTFSQDGTPMLSNPPTPTPGPSWRAVLKPYLPHLLRWAQEGHNPELRALVVMEELPEEHVDTVGRIVHRPGFLDEFVATVQGAAPHRPWFKLFIEKLQDQIVYDAPEPQEEDDGAGVEVGTGNPPGDED